jgi:hypothetical protein
MSALRKLMRYFKNLMDQNQLEGLFLDLLLCISQLFFIFLLADGLIGPFLHGHQRDRQNQSYLAVQLRPEAKLAENPKAITQETPNAKEAVSAISQAKNASPIQIDHPEHLALGETKNSDEMPFFEQSSRGFQGQAPILQHIVQNAPLQQQQQNQAMQQHQQMLGVMQAQSQLQNLLSTLAEDQIFICTNRGAKTFHCKSTNGQASYLEGVLNNLFTQDQCTTIRINQTQGLMKSGC